MDLQPGKYFSIVKQIPDPNDTATYYVRSVIRNAEDDSTLSTVNLTDRGGGRHSANWQIEPNVPEDGLWIAITTTVYTNAAYTIKSAVYGEELETHHIINKPTHFGGGGAGNISYERIADLVKQELDRREHDAGLEQIEGLMKQLQVQIAKDKVDHDRKILRIEEAVKGIDIPEPAKFPDVDLGPVMRAIGSIKIPDVSTEAIAGALVRAVRLEIYRQISGIQIKDKEIIMTGGGVIDERPLREIMRDARLRGRPVVGRRT